MLSSTKDSKALLQTTWEGPDILLLEVFKTRLNHKSSLEVFYVMIQMIWGRNQMISSNLSQPYIFCDLDNVRGKGCIDQAYKKF